MASGYFMTGTDTEVGKTWCTVGLMAALPGDRGRAEEAEVNPQVEPTPPYAVERSARHAERPGFRITELQIGPSQEVPWHYHTTVQDTFYVLEGAIRVQVREPEQELILAPGETCAVQAHRPHRVSNAGGGSAVFLVLQGIGTYDFIPVS